VAGEGLGFVANRAHHAVQTHTTNTPNTPIEVLEGASGQHYSLRRAPGDGPGATD